MKLILRKFCLPALLLSLFLPPASVASAAEVTTTVPVVKLIADSLLQNTQVDVSYLPPRRLPYNRIGNWLQHKAAAARLKGYDAVLTVESLRPDLAAYTLLRQQNIRIVPVDLTAELNPGGMRISPTAKEGYFWLHPDNLLMMVNIAAADLARLWPEHSAVIMANRQTLRRQIQHYQLNLDQLLLDAEIDEVLITSQNLIQAAQSTALPLASSATTSQDFPGHRLRIKANSRSNDKPAQRGLWVLDPIARYGTRSLPQVLESNIQALQAAL